MDIDFHKYHGAGNDFIMINDIDNTLSNYLSTNIIQNMCNRHFGIGADGLIVLQRDNKLDFKMLYYNADGKEGTMCGNGGRCIVAFAKMLSLIKKDAKFNAIDGEHYATFNNDDNISINMTDVKNVKIFPDYVILNTGSPHYVKFVNNLNSLDIYNEGKAIRNQFEYSPDGINVNFITNDKNLLNIRTYERGVENETLACGTGSVASAIASCINKADGYYSVDILTRGGKLNVCFTKSADKYVNISLKGPAQFVYKGQFKIS